MNLPLHRIAAPAGVTAYTISLGLQVYRSLQGTGLTVDRLSAPMAVTYAALMLLSALLVTDRRWVWWTNLVVCSALFLQAPFGYYPWVYGSRHLQVWDWLEGTWFTALLFLVAACAVARIFGQSAKSGVLTADRP
jgi:hypothetical protein